MFCAKTLKLKRQRIMIRSLVLIVLQLFYSKFIVKLQQIPITDVLYSKFTAKLQ